VRLLPVSVHAERIGDCAPWRLLLYDIQHLLLTQHALPLEVASS
jgi:hypothetical protein